MNPWKEQAQLRFSSANAASKWNEMYEIRTDRLEEENFRLRCDYAVQLVAARFEPAATIVDLGCGAGPVLAGLWARGYGAVGLDCSPDMLAYARRRLSSIGASPNVLLQGDVTALPFADGSVDCVICLGVISYVQDRAQAFREIHRILRPGGLALISFRNRFNPICSDPAAAAAYLVKAIVPGQPTATRRIGQTIDPREVGSEVAGAGLHTEHVEGIGLGPLRFRRRTLMSERRSIALSRGGSAWCGRLKLKSLSRWISDVNVYVCTRPG